MSLQGGGGKPASVGRPVPEYFQPLIDRGIALDVILGRGYEPYYGNRHALFDEAERDRYLRANWPQLLRPVRGTYTPMMDMKRKMSIVPGIDPADPDSGLKKNFGRGLVMPKYAFPGAPPIMPQLRPETPLLKPDRWHFHSGPARRSPKRDRYTGNFLVAANGQPIFDVQGAAYDIDSDQGWRLYRKHIIEKHDSDFDFPLEVTHSHPDAVKYSLPVGPRGSSRRLDVHPMARERLGYADRIFFVLEGTPKADSVLTFIRRQGLAATVFDTPSVTTHRASELKAAARRYLSRPNESGHKPLLVIVPDADWYANKAVIDQARLARHSWQQANVDVCIAAPPVLDYWHQHECSCLGVVAADGSCSSCGGYKKGVDDWLAAGGDLDRLMVNTQHGRFLLAEFADRQGYVSGSFSTLASRIGCRRDVEAVSAEIDHMIEAGMVERESGTFARRPDVPPLVWPSPRLTVRYRGQIATVIESPLGAAGEDDDEAPAPRRPLAVEDVLAQIESRAGQPIMGKDGQPVQLLPQTRVTIGIEQKDGTRRKTRVMLKSLRPITPWQYGTMTLVVTKAYRLRDRDDTFVPLGEYVHDQRRSESIADEICRRAIELQTAEDGAGPIGVIDRHIDAAMIATAEARGLKLDTVKDDAPPIRREFRATRDHAIQTDPRPDAEVAEDWEITPERVRQIRRQS